MANVWRDRAAPADHAPRRPFTAPREAALQRSITLPLVGRASAPARPWSLALVGTVTAGALLLAHQWFYLRAIGFDAIDDAYISFVYARNLARGAGLVFNPGERVEGYTNLLWTLLLAPAIRLGAPPAPVALALGAAAALATLPLTARALVREQPALGTLTALLLAVDGSFALWSVSGLETTLFTFLLTAGAIVYFRELEQPGRFPWSGLLFGLATLTRPEGALVLVCTVLHAVLWRWKSAGRPAVWQDLGRIALFLALAGGQELFRLLYYGRPVPNTYTAKVELGALAELLRGWNALSLFVYLRGGWPAFLLLPIGARRLWRSGAALQASYCTLVVYPYVLYIVVVGGDWSVGRFFVPLLPFAYVLAAAGLLAVGGRAEILLRRVLSLSGRRRAALRGVALGAVLLGLFLGSSIWGEVALYVQPFHVAEVGRERTALGRWLRTHTPKDAVIAVDAAGQVPYDADRRFIDLYGLNTPAIANLRDGTVGEGLAGHDRFGLDYALRVDRPDYVVIYGRLLDAPVYQTHYRRLDNWTADPQLRRRISLYIRR